jgi:type I restriction enzyme M protein
VDDERIARFKQPPFFIDIAISKKRKDKESMAAEVEAGRKIQEQILQVLEDMKPSFVNGELIKERTEFEKLLKKIFKDSPIKWEAKLRNALLAPGSLGEKDPSAEICFDSKGNPEADPELRDTENVQLPDGIKLPLPLDYESKKNKGKVDKSELLALVQAHCEEYLALEVLPYRDDAWIDHSKIKVGYEIPFNRHFYQYEPPRPLGEIEADINGLEKEILDMLKGVV